MHGHICECKLHNRQDKAQILALFAVMSLCCQLLPARVEAAEIEPVSGLASTQPEMLSLVPGQGMGSISRFVDVLESPAGRDLDAVLRTDNVFIRNTEAFVNPGTTRDIIWLRLEVENPTDRAGEWILSLNRALLSDVGMYLVRGGNVEVLLDDSHDSMVGSYREFRTLAGRFTLPPQSSAQIFVRYQGANWGGLLPLLSTAQSHQAAVMSDLAIFLALLGGIVTLVGIGSISFLFLGREVVAYYALAQLSFFAFYTHFTGISTVYLFPEQAQSLRFVAPLTMGLFILFICQFSRHFFETWDRLPTINRVLRWLVGVVGIAIPFILVGYVIPGFDTTLPLFLLYLVSVIAWIILPGLAIYATLKWQKDYWPLVVAWTSTGLFILTMQLVWLGLVSVMPLQENMFGVVTYLEAAFLALAIALRIKVLREEALLAEKQLSESLRAELATSERARRLFEEREWALQDLAEKGRLLLTAGHDTRQMISALRNYSAGIRIVSKEEKVEQATYHIDDIVENLNEVLTTAVEGSRSGGITDSTLALDTVRPEKILNAVVLVHGSSAREKNIELSVHVSAGPIVTDRVLVGRVLSNLLSNAIKNTRDGRIIMACRAFQGGHRFQVWDQGAGIEPDALKVLLDPATVAMRLNTESEGLGSGLSIVKTLATRLGARIDARSVPGRGSVFELIHPGISPLTVQSQAEGAQTSIILADNDAGLAEIFARAMSGTGLTFARWHSPESLPADTGKPASDIALLFIDEHFGGANKGLESARKYSESNGSTRTLLLSYNRSVEARMEMAREASLLLYKPVSSAAIRAAIAYALSRN